MHDSFFALGGDSILSIQLVSAARKAGIVFTPQDVFRHRTVSGLLAVAGRTTVDEEARDTAPAPEADGTPGRPTPLQEGLLFLSQYDGLAPFDGHQGAGAQDSGSWGAGADRLDVYHVQVVIRLAGTLDADRLRTALRTVVHRHDPLRTGFTAGEDGWAQRVHADAEPEVDELDLRRRKPREQERRALRRIDDERRRRFGLTAPPLLRATLIHRTDTTELVLTGHHLVLDGWSLPLLVREILHGYAGLDLPARPGTPPTAPGSTPRTRRPPPRPGGTPWTGSPNPPGSSPTTPASPNSPTSTWCRWTPDSPRASPRSPGSGNSPWAPSPRPCGAWC